MSHPPILLLCLPPSLLLLWCLWLFLQNWSDVFLAFDITCIICVLGIPRLTSHSLRLSFFLFVTFPSAETSARTRSRPFPGKLSEESQASKTCKHLSLTSANTYYAFFLLLIGSDCYTLFLTADVAQVCMNSCYFKHNRGFFVSKILWKISFR